MTGNPFWRIAREVTDEVMGPGSYARANAGSPDPRVREQVMLSEDPVLAGMAAELHHALVVRGLDTKNPPASSTPPTGAAWDEYLRRGGTVYGNADQFATALVAAVVAK